MMAQGASSKSATSGSSESAHRQEPRHRWFYAQEDDWATFGDDDNEALERRLQKLGGESQWMQQRQEKDEKEQQSGLDAPRTKPNPDGKPGIDLDQTGMTATLSKWWWSGDKDEEEEEKDKKNLAVDKQDEPPLVEEILDPDEPESERQSKVAVLEDKLFDVDISEMTIYPAFFKGVLLRVVRARWFYWSEMREQYSPIAWQSDLSQDLDMAWERKRAWELPAESEDPSGTEKRKAKANKDDGDMIEIRNDETDEKSKVRFNSPVEGSVFSEDLRGRIVSLVGGFTVIRGFDEIERRTAAKANQEGRPSMFSFPDTSLPWSKRDSSNDREAVLNERVKATGKKGAAKPGSKDSAAASGDDESDSRSLLGRLWPSSDAWLQPGTSLLNALGLSSDSAKESGKKKSTQEAAQPDSEMRKRNQKHTGEHQAEGEEDEEEEEEEGDEEDADAEGTAEATSPKEEFVEDLKDEPVHLVLVIHGIGQGLRDDFEAIDFTWDVQKLRNLSRERAQDNGIRKLSRGRRVQYIPVCWRRGMEFPHQGEEADNKFGLSDVTNDATIPFVRNIVSKVILDIPFYLSSSYKGMMVATVTAELNRIYRLFVRRNPSFLDKGGKVSIIGHSLGSALAADILSKQPTTVPSMDSLAEEEIKKLSRERLLFSTEHLFLVGSPLGLFLLLGGGQLIARRNKRNAHIGPDASHDGPGRFGCLAIDGSIFNCYNASDPVAYRLNGAVDQRYGGQILKPMPLPGAVAAILDALRRPRLSITKLFDPQRPFETAGKRDLSEWTSQSLSGQPKYGETRDERMNDADKHKLVDRAAKQKTTKEKGEKGEDPDDDSALPSGVTSPVRLEQGDHNKKALPDQIHHAQKQEASELRGHPELDDLSSLARAERRFRALNSHGCVDFYFASASSPFSEYLSMLSAHNSYWQSESFVSLILTQVFDAKSRRESGSESDGDRAGSEKGEGNKDAVAEAKPTVVPQVKARSLQDTGDAQAKQG